MNVINRGKYENKKHKYGAFLTLTYDDNHLFYLDKPFGENVPVGLPSTCKKHIHKFTDDLRHYIKYHNPDKCEKDFSFLYCTEYGGTFSRPHIHIALFGVDFPIAKKIAQSLWKNGFVDSRPITSGTVKYIAKYINKGAKGKYADLQYTDKGIEKPVVKWSKGFGSGYYKEHIDDLKRFGYIREGNKKVFIPTYYKNRIVNNNMPQLYRQEINKQCTLQEKLALAKHFGYKDVLEFEKGQAMKFCRNEFYKNLNNKMSIDLEEIR